MTYAKTNNAIRNAARKISNNGVEMTDEQIVEAVEREIGRKLDRELQQDRVAIRAFRDHRKDAEKAAKGESDDG